MSNKALAQQLRDLKAECEKIAEDHQAGTRTKCAQILLAAAGLHMLREKVAKCGVGGTRV